VPHHRGGHVRRCRPTAVAGSHSCFASAGRGHHIKRSGVTPRHELRCPTGRHRDRRRHWGHCRHHLSCCGDAGTVAGILEVERLCWGEATVPHHRGGRAVFGRLQLRGEHHHPRIRFKNSCQQLARSPLTDRHHLVFRLHLPSKLGNTLVGCQHIGREPFEQLIGSLNLPLQNFDIDLCISKWTCQQVGIRF